MRYLRKSSIQACWQDTVQYPSLHVLSVTPVNTPTSSFQVNNVFVDAAVVNRLAQLLGRITVTTIEDDAPTELKTTEWPLPVVAQRVEVTVAEYQVVIVDREP